MKFLGNLLNWATGSEVDKFVTELGINVSELDLKGKNLYHKIKNDKSMHLNACETACFFFMIYVPSSPDAFTQTYGPTVWSGRAAKFLRQWVREGKMREEVAIQIASGIAEWGKASSKSSS